MGMELRAFPLNAGPLKASILKAVQPTVNDSTFNKPLTHNLTDGWGFGAASFARADAQDRYATVTDFEGRVIKCKANEARFNGVRRVENLSDGIADAGYTSTIVNASVTTTGISDPFGGTNAIRVTMGASKTCTGDYYKAFTVQEATATVKGSYYIRPVSGAAAATIVSVNLHRGDVSTVGTSADLKTLTEGEWIRFGTQVSTTNNSTTRYRGFTIVAITGVEDVVFDIACIQHEDITGQTVQEPSEYVSKGVGTGNEILPNGTFDDNDTTDWTVTFGAITSNRLDDNGTQTLWATSNTNLKIGKSYIVTYTRGGTSTDSVAPSSGNVGLTSRSAAGTYTQVITATGNSSAFSIIKGGGTGSIWIDNISVKPVDHGANVDGVKYFDHHNLITETSNIIDETYIGQGQKFGVRYENLCNYDGGFNLETDATIGTASRTVLGDDHILLEGMTSSTSVGWRIGFADKDHTGRKYIVSVDIRAPADDATQIGKDVRTQIRTANSSTVQTLSHTLTADWVRHSSGVFSGDVTNQAITVNLCGSVAGGVSAEYRNLMIEELTYKDVEQPGPYVSYGVESFPEHNQSFGDGFKEFPYLNGNTHNVTTGVVTEARGSSKTPGDGILIEESRTNACHQSEDFSTTWITLRQAAPTTNSIAAPDGTTTADTLTDDGATNNTHIIYSNDTSVGVAIAANACGSVYLKAKTFQHAELRVGNTNAASSVSQMFTLTGAGSVTTVTAATGGWSLNGSGIEYVGDGWYRCWVAANTDGVATGLRLSILLSDDGTSATYDAAVTSGDIYAWGAQIEEDVTFPTSYIPTTTASVTREIDDLYYSLANLPDGDFSMVATYTPFQLTSFDDKSVAVGTYKSAPSYDGTRIGLQSATNAQGFVRAAGVNQTSYVTVSPSIGQQEKIGMVWQEGVKLTTTANGTVDATPDTTLTTLDYANLQDKIVIGGYRDVVAADERCFGCVKDVKIYSAALSDAQMETLTT